MPKREPWYLVAYNRGLRIAIMERDGQSREVPLTKFVDADGEDCDPMDAVAIAGGSDETGWFDALTEGDEQVSLN